MSHNLYHFVFRISLRFMKKLKYCFDKIIYDQKLLDDRYQSSFLFSFVDELKSVLEEKNNLVGNIALLCAIEIAGRTALEFKNTRNKKITNKESFNFFLEEYMGYSALLKQESKIYDILRNGMVHSGFPKFEYYGSGGFGSGYNEDLFKERRGINIDNGEQLSLVSDVLLLEYLNGVKQFREDELKNNWTYWPPDEYFDDFEKTI